MADQPYQSLYRRYRPQRFSEVRGQDHVTRALTNAVRDDRVAHAYLFSGPRGTGKTSTARILAKALNCAAPQAGEPCGVCDSCVQVQLGASLDVHELDAASQSRVDYMRDLVSRAALGTPGRWKVYIVDEVHILSAAASNALLKTLEEPPGHVVFVLATTDPQKVLPTIRSRTQHYEFRLLPADVLQGLLRDVSRDAALAVAPEAIDLVVQRGKGSARDALSALDQVAAAGSAEDAGDVQDQLLEALADGDPAAALTAVAEACAAGRDPRRVAEDVLAHLRQAFLALMARGLVDLPDDAAVRVEEQARRIGAPSLVRAMETLGDALVDMREALDTRVYLEVAMIRLTRADADVSAAGLLQRIERLERAVDAAGSAPAIASARNAAERAGEAPPRPAPPARPVSPPSPGAAGARAALGAHRGTRGAGDRRPSTSPPAGPAPAPAREPTPTAASSEPTPSGSVPDRDALTLAWADHVLEQLPPRARARVRGGRFVGVVDGTAEFALPNKIHRDRCDEVKSDVEAALRAHFGASVPLRFVVEEEAPPTRRAATERGPFDDDDAIGDINALEDAPPAVASAEDRVREAFPGAEEV